MVKNNIVNELIKEISKISKKFDLHPLQLTKSQFLQESKFQEWDLRKVGGLSKIIRSHFPQADKDLKIIQENKQHVQHINKLERQVGNMELFRDRLIASVTKEVSKMKRQPLILDSGATQRYLKSIASRPGKEKIKSRSICTIWSDQHFGTEFDLDEMGGVNEFNWLIGARRLGMLCEQIATYKIERRPEHEELVIFLAGDNIAGVIHNQEGSELITPQICGAVKYYTQALDYLRQFFPKIRVECQPGNHGRVMHKEQKGRAMQNKWDSFENVIFLALSTAFRGDKMVEINVPKTPFCDTVVQGHKIYSTHGDTVFDVGNPGKTVPLSRIEAQVNRINAEQQSQGNKAYELFCTGHVHHPVFTHVGAGVKIVINGCLIGTDPYALSIGIQSSQPVQVLWETTRKYVQGDIRNIYVDGADKEVKYDKIIKPYKGELTI